MGTDIPAARQGLIKFIAKPSAWVLATSTRLSGSSTSPRSRHCAGKSGDELIERFPRQR
jgi:hypothetical protein